MDAKTGEGLKNESGAKTEYAYGDVSGHYAKTMIETLAGYGVGYEGDSFLPDSALTQKDALTLIVAACGYELDQGAEDYEDSLYAAAYSLGILGKADKSPGTPVNRANLVKLIINAAGYGEVAQLKDISRPFEDENEVPRRCTVMSR